MKSLVIYHANCADGFGAAFAAWLKLGDAAEYIPMNYGELDSPQALAEFFDETIGERIVYILDFSMCKQTMDWLFEHAKNVIWLDHHKTAFEMYCGEYNQNDRFARAILGDTYIILDDNKSGAMLAWEWFHDGEPPMFIRHIDDRDRWQFKLPKTREFNAALFNERPWTFESWKDNFLGKSLDQFYIKGETLIRNHDQRVQAALLNARECQIIPDVTNSAENYQSPWTCCARGLMCNATSDLTSDLGHELANKSGTFGLVWYIDKHDVVRCSLRSNGEYDVSEIAKVFGGGGHKNAAGFSMSVKRFVEMFYGDLYEDQDE